jgi:hypothetical protein
VNPRNHLKVLTTLCLGSLGLATFGQTSPATVPSPAKAAPSTQAMIHYGQLPLSFEPNRGQTSSNVQWLARGPEYTLFLAGNDAVLQMNKITPCQARFGRPKEAEAQHQLVRGADEPARGQNPAASSPARIPSPVRRTTSPEMILPSGSTTCRCTARCGCRACIPAWIWCITDISGELEYDFVVAPGADRVGDQAAIRRRQADPGSQRRPGAAGGRWSRGALQQAGCLPDGGWRAAAGDGSFVIADNNRRQQVSFQLGAYDHSRELVIDPTLLFVGVFGTGNYETQAIGMAVDASGEIILTGETSDVNLPVTTGAYQTTCNQDSTVAAANNYVRCGGSSEGYLGSAFITKISADGTSLVYSTYLHGFSGSELGQAVATDAAGDAIVLGQTGSSDFPVTSNAISIAVHAVLSADWRRRR